MTINRISSFRLLQLIIVILFLSKNIHSANILFVGNVPSLSHLIWCRTLSHELVRNGHNVTLISPDEDHVPQPKNYTFIYIEGVYDRLYKNYDFYKLIDYGPTKMIIGFQEWSWHKCKSCLKSKGLKTLLDYPQDFKFDLIIFDITLGSCLYPLIERFNYPTAMGVTAFLLPTYTSYYFGNSIFPSYIPWYCLPYSTSMNLMERFWNHYFQIVDIALRYFIEYPKNDRMAREVFGSNTSDWETLEKHLTVVLANTDPLLDFPQPLPPNIIPVGGLHTRQPKPLPKELQKIMDNSKNGVIIFSLGTNVRSDKLTENDQNALISAFSRLEQTVIWKYESDKKNLPKNVFVVEWLPQNDLLAHANTKLFIGHGGALSTQEAIYHGVPIIGMPFMFDQFLNVKMVVKKRLGLYLDATKLTETHVYNTIKEVIDNPIYRENTKMTSIRFKDRLQTPLEVAVYWVEYVMRHQGAHFLNTPARYMPFYASSGLDVAFLFISFVILVFVILFVVARLIISCISKNTRKIKQN